MFNTIANILKVEDLRRRILFTLFLLIVYRIGAFIPVPNINTDVLKLQDQANQSDVFGLLNTFSGGALFQFSIFAMGIMPYITASIIVQLFSMDVIPKFAQWAKEGEYGKKENDANYSLRDDCSRVDSSFWISRLDLTACTVI